MSNIYGGSSDPVNDNIGSVSPGDTQFIGILGADCIQTDKVVAKDSIATIDLTTSDEIDLQATSVLVNGAPIGGSITLQDSYDNSTPAQTQLATTKPYTIKAVDTTTLFEINGDTKNVDITGTLDANDYKLSGVQAHIPYEDTAATNINMGVNMGAITTGVNNTVYGRSNGALIADGAGNTSIGYFNMNNNVSGDNNTALGFQNCINVKGSNNIAIGVANNAFAPATPANATADNNIGIGFACLRNVEGSPFNVSIGNSASFNLISGTGQNVSIGRSANVSGTTLQGGTAIGALADCVNFNNCIALGFGATCTKTNQCTIGNGNLVEIVSESVGGCDLGSSTRPFKDIWANGTVDAGDYVLDGDQGYLPISSLAGELKSGTNLAVSVGTNNISYGINNANLATGTNNTVIVGKDNCQNGNPSTSTCVGTNNMNYCLSTKNVVVGTGNLSTISATPANCFASDNVCIGDGNMIRVENSDDNIVIGSNNLVNHVSNLNGRNIVIGKNSGNTNTDKNDAIVIGFNSSSNFDNSVLIGDNITGTKTQQIMLGSSNITEIVNEGNGVCNLGSATNQFEALYLSGMATIGGLTFPKPFFEAFSDDNTTVATTSSATIGNYVKCDFPTSPTSGFIQANPDNQSFTVDATTNRGRVTYTGTTTRTFHCGVTISVFPTSNSNHDWKFAVFKNGTILTGSTVEITTTSSSDRYSTAIHIFAKLATNDYIELYTANNTAASQDITIHYTNFFGLALPNAV